MDVEMKLLPVFYDQQMICDVKSFSPSAAKPKAVIDSWLKDRMPIALRAVSPASNEILKLAHAESYVDGVFAGRELNGFGTREPIVAETCRYTVGAMIDATREAISNGKVAIAPVAGFHHAGYADAFGYCTFNGLVIAALVMKREGLANRVAILDLDVHEGDGTKEIIEKLGLDNFIVHHSLGYAVNPVPENADIYLSLLPSVIDSMKQCDVVLYQASADPHVDDPLGGFLTTEQLRERDRIVFESCSRMGLPVAWNIAGGYQKDDDGGISKILQLHHATLEECIANFVD
ncbi:MAG: histone deacetylase [Rheinheimera sp.]|nr:MAG: histone deacetylase [Rheinheimera sp.]